MQTAADFLRFVAENNYHRIAGFLNGDARQHRIARFLHGHGQGKHPGDYSAENINLKTVLDRLTTGRVALSTLADLTDEQLDTIPPARDMKFCDGQRTLEQIVTNMLKHQNHQLDAMKAASALREANWAMVSHIHMCTAGIDYLAHARDHLARADAAWSVFQHRHGKPRDRGLLR